MIGLSKTALAKIEARATKATPGVINVLAAVQTEVGGPWLYSATTSEDARGRTADSKFMVQAREDVLSLLAEVRRLKGETGEQA